MSPLVFPVITLFIVNIYWIWICFYQNMSSFCSVFTIASDGFTHLRNRYRIIYNENFHTNIIISFTINIKTHSSSSIKKLLSCYSLRFPSHTRIYCQQFTTLSWSLYCCHYLRSTCREVVSIPSISKKGSLRVLPFEGVTLSNYSPKRKTRGTTVRCFMWELFCEYFGLRGGRYAYILLWL